MGFGGNSSSVMIIGEEYGKEKERPYSREQIISIARKAESLGYDSLSVNGHIIFRTSWLTHYATLSAAVATITDRIKLGTSIVNIVLRNPAII
jgi:alkanesulfonate monooxygenase SsuD/methylene tetrahydromethanopterin reductase-like flavin-dependent oxidoreductase (luciferase family)